MQDNSQRSRRIARNTLMLYVRMLFLLLVGFYTSRVVLDSLGENDYGIYTVVGGVVAMFTMISGALNSAVSRYITFEMGKGKDARLGKVFSTSVTIQLILSFLVVIITEPVGIWFIRLLHENFLNFGFFYIGKKHFAQKYCFLCEFFFWENLSLNLLKIFFYSQYIEQNPRQMKPQSHQFQVFLCVLCVFQDIGLGETLKNKVKSLCKKI